ncbi:hypothetical protein FA13DRAFT_1738710, partial [Coprinellus micaceus]
MMAPVKLCRGRVRESNRLRLQTPKAVSGEACGNSRCETPSAWWYAASNVSDQAPRDHKKPAFMLGMHAAPSITSG